MCTYIKAEHFVAYTLILYKKITKNETIRVDQLYKLGIEMKSEHDCDKNWMLLFSPYSISKVMQDYSHLFVFEQKENGEQILSIKNEEHLKDIFYLSQPIETFFTPYISKYKTALQAN